MAFSPDGRWLASNDGIETLIWDLQQRQLRHVLPGHRMRPGADASGSYPVPASSLAFSPNGQYLASSSWTQGGSNRSLVVWDVATGQQHLSLAGSRGCRQALFSPDGTRLLGACGRGVQLWQASTGRALFGFDRQRPVGSLALHPNGQIAATAALQTGQDGSSSEIRLWRLHDGKAQQLRSLRVQGPVSALAFGGDGQRLVASSLAGHRGHSTVSVWHWRRGRLLRTLSGLDPSGRFRLSPSGSAIAGNFGTTILRNWQTGISLATEPAIRMQGEATALAFSPDGQTLAWAGQPPTFPYPIIRFWRRDGGAEAQGQPPTLHRPERAGYGLFFPERLANEVTVSNPRALVAQAWGLEQAGGSTQQQIVVSSPYPSKQVVRLTQTGLRDDSVAGIRYRAEFVAYGESWRLVWSGKQQTCQPGRGPQTWSDRPCH